jgi:hypothetical protein
MNNLEAYLSNLESIVLYLQEQNPKLYIDFVSRCWPKILEIKRLQEKFEANEKQEILLNEECDRLTKIVSSNKAILGTKLFHPSLVILLEAAQKSGLMTVSLVTLFSISGVLSILNPFAEPQKLWGVIFIIWASYSLTMILSATIVKTIYRNNTKNWQLPFWGLRIIDWFVILLIAIISVEGICGGFLASDLIDRGREAVAAMSEQEFIRTTWYEKIKLSLIMGLFAFVNVTFACAKGFELRRLLPNQIRHDAAASQLKVDKERLDNLISENKELISTIHNLQEEISYPLEQAVRDIGIKELSNVNTQGKDMEFIGKHPGKYKAESQTEKFADSSISPESNGHKKLEGSKNVAPIINSSSERYW